jgi:metallo-beta-lactamase family protein
MIGYQAYGTIGRRLVDGEKFIRLWGEAIRVNAQVHTLNGLSAHGGQKDLLRWIKPQQATAKIWLVHGEQRALSILEQTLQQRGADAAIMPAGQKMLL